MADIELVIKIPEEMYKWVNDVNKFFGDYGTSDFIDLIKNGTPLPKGHGRLIDADQLEKEIEDYSKGAFAMTPEFLVKDAPTIIEADKQTPSYLWKCERCGKLIPYMADFCYECADELLGEPPKPFEPKESDHKCRTCKHYTRGEHDGSCGSYICKEYSNWESEGAE